MQITDLESTQANFLWSRRVESDGGAPCADAECDRTGRSLKVDPGGTAKTQSSFRDLLSCGVGGSFEIYFQSSGRQRKREVTHFAESKLL